MAHSIDQAIQSQKVTRVIVSADSETYAAIARNYGAETPFLRPRAIAGDLSTDLEVFHHALRWLEEHEGYRPDLCVHLRPTYPTRQVEDIDRAIEILLEDPNFDSVRSVVESPETPYKIWFMEKSGSLSPVLPSDLHEPYNLARQSLPATYLQNACVDVVRSRVILSFVSISPLEIRSWGAFRGG